MCLFFIAGQHGRPQPIFHNQRHPRLACSRFQFLSPCTFFLFTSILGFSGITQSSSPLTAFSFLILSPSYLHRTDPSAPRWPCRCRCKHLALRDLCRCVRLANVVWSLRVKRGISLSVWLPILAYVEHLPPPCRSNRSSTSFRTTSPVLRYDQRRTIPAPAATASPTTTVCDTSTTNVSCPFRTYPRAAVSF